MTENTVLTASSDDNEKVYCDVFECLTDSEDIVIKTKLQRVGNKMLTKMRKEFVTVVEGLGESEYNTLTNNRTQRIAERIRRKRADAVNIYTESTTSYGRMSVSYVCEESKDILMRIDASAKLAKHHKNRSSLAQDREVVRKFYENPSPDAFSLLWDRFKFGVHTHVSKIIGDWERAEDIVQDTFSRAWEKKFTYDPEKSNFGTWLYTIARNITFSQLKKDAQDRTIDVDVNDVYASSLYGNTVDNTAHTDDAYYIINDSYEVESNSFEQVTEKIYDASVNEIRTMDPLFQEIFELKAVKGLTLREIAAQKGMTESKVKNCYYKNRELLEETLREKYNDLYVVYLDASHDHDDEESLYY